MSTDRRAALVLLVMTALYLAGTLLALKSP
jgi:hypothetical protein